MKIILLNGPSSAGKTSLVKELQKTLPDPYLATGLDNIIYMIPASLNDYLGDLKPRIGFGWKQEVDEQGRVLNHLTPGSYGKQVYQMLKRKVKFLADEGFNVIVDHVALLPDDYRLWREILKEHHLLFIGVSASPEVLDQREINRGDRMIGGSRAQQKQVHNQFIYDVEIDTTQLSSVEAAERILAQIKQT